MEKYFRWQINCGCSDEEITEGVMTHILNLRLREQVKSLLEEYKDKIEYELLSNALNALIDADEEIGHPGGFMGWVRSKEEVTKRLLEMVNSLDIVLVSQGYELKTSCVERVGKVYEETMQNVQSINVTSKDIDFGDVELEDGEVDELLFQVSKANEDQILIRMLDNEDIPIVPIDEERYKNSVVEGKLKKINNNLNYVDNSLNDNYNKVLSQLNKMFDAYHATIFGNYIETEKEERVSKITKKLDGFKLRVNELQDYLMDAVELNRQLKVHDQSLREKYNEKIEDLENKIRENSQDEKSINDRNALRHTTQKYLTGIANADTKLDGINEAIKSRIVAVEEMIKYLSNVYPTKGKAEEISKLNFGAQDFKIKLDVAFSQNPNAGNTEKTLYNSTSELLDGFILYLKDAKNAFLRGSMAEAIFNAYFVFKFANYKDPKAYPELTEETRLVIDKNKPRQKQLVKEYNNYFEDLVKYGKKILTMILDELYEGLTDVTLLHMSEILHKGMNEFTNMFDKFNDSVRNLVNFHKTVMKA